MLMKLTAVKYKYFSREFIKKMLDYRNKTKQITNQKINSLPQITGFSHFIASCNMTGQKQHK